MLKRKQALLTVPHARAFIVEDLRNGGDPKNSHGIVEVKLERGQAVEGEVLAARLLHHGQGEGQTWLLLETRLCHREVWTGVGRVN
jgi:hypothetical protein